MLLRFFVLITLATLVWGFAIVEQQKGITVQSFAAGSPLSMQVYNTDELLDPSQDWLYNTSTSQFYLRYYPNLVLGTSTGSDVLVLDTFALNVNTLPTTHWRGTLKGNAFSYVNQASINHIAHKDGKVILTSTTQSFWTLFEPFPAADYIVAGAGTAGAKIAKRLTDDFVTSVIAIEAGPRVDDNPVVQKFLTLAAPATSAFFNFLYYSEMIDNLGGSQVPSAVGKMWGGTSNHNGMFYDRGLKYDWDLMEAAGGPNWNYEKYIHAEFIEQEDYNGTTSTSFGRNGEVSIVDSIVVPNILFDIPFYATQQFYPSFKPLPGGLNDNLVGSATIFQLTMQNLGNGIYNRESSSTAHLNTTVVTPDGQGVGGRKLRVIGESFVDQILFHPLFPKKAIGVKYIDKEGSSCVVLANKEVIVSAGVYGSPAILMRSGIGNCCDLSALNISCRENSEYVGANLQDHVRVQIEVAVPLSSALEVIANVKAQNTDGSVFEGRIYTNMASTYTDFDISNTPQPDTKLAMTIYPLISYPELAALYGFNWLTFSGVKFPAIFDFAALLLRPKCMGQVRLASSQPAAYPIIASNYLCHPDDVSWAQTIIKNLSAIVNTMSLNDTSYYVAFPPQSMINTTQGLNQIVTALTNSYRHPAGTCRMAPRDATNRGVVDGNLRVHGIQSVRVADASVFVTVPSSNPQASIYALAGRAVKIIKGR